MTLCITRTFQGAAKEDRSNWQQRLQSMELELQANKLQIQQLMQQLHAISAGRKAAVAAGSTTFQKDGPELQAMVAPAKDTRGCNDVAVGSASEPTTSSSSGRPAKIVALATSFWQLQA